MEIKERYEDGLVAAVVERFDAHPARARDDVRGFVSSLRERGLVVEA